MVFLIALAAASTVPFFYAAGGHLPQAHDLRIHWVRMIAFDEVLRSGVLYPRWLSSLNYGLGAATTSFYAPGIYYLMSVSHWVTGNWTSAIELGVVSAAVASAVAFYGYARQLMPSLGATIATALYLLLPYRMIDLYHRGALAELLGFVWMPLVLLSFSLSLRRASALNLVMGGVAFGALVLTHPPTAYVFALTLAIIAVVIAIRSRSWRPLVIVFVFGIMGGALSAFYSLPAFLELSYVKQEITATFEARAGDLKDLITGGPFEQMLAAIAFTGLVLSLACYFFSSKAWVSEKSVRDDSIGWLIVSVALVGAMAPFSRMLLRPLPGFNITGFLWRWLAIQVISVAILAGLAFQAAWRSDRRRVVLLAVLTGTVLIFGFSASAVAVNLRLPFEAPSAAVEEAFTPAGAPGVGDLDASPAPVLSCVSGDATISVVESKPLHRRAEMSSDAGCVLESHTFVFPGWRATIDGREASAWSHETKGTMLVEVPPGRHEVTVEFIDTPVRRIAGWVTCGSLALCMALSLGGAAAGRWRSAGNEA